MSLVLKDGAEVEGVIDALDDEGRGRMGAEALSANLDVCVRGAFPGDHVRARVERCFPVSGVAQARALHLLSAGPMHVPRDCPHAAPCPGCPLHGLEEHVALDLKRARLQRALDDVALQAPVLEVVPSESPRQKVKLVVEGGRVGLYVPHTHVLVDAHRCPYHHPAIERALERLRPHLQPPVKAVIARAFSEGVGVVLVCGAPMRDDVFRALGALVDGRPVVSLALRVDPSGGNSLLGGEVQHTVGPQLLTPLEGGPPVAVDAFCQPDPILSVQMNRRAAQFLTDGGDGVFADLYAGAGGFSRALLAAGASRVIAVERAPASAAALKALPLRALERSVEDAFDVLREEPLAGVVADPPKKGLGSVAAPLAALGARRVVLVACDPDAGARDARTFVDAGYALLSVEPVDLFPGSPEVEALFLLQR